MNRVDEGGRLRPGRPLCWAALGLTALLVACSPGTKGPNSPLRVGMELAYPPFEMRDAEGAPAGVSVELARELGRALGRSVEIENIAFDGLIASLKTGKIDLIISSMTSTQQRAKSIDFSEPYLKTGLCLLVGKESEVEGFGDVLVGEGSVVVKTGTTGHHQAVQSLPRDRILVLDSESSCVLEVVQGKAIAFIYDQMSTYKNWQRNPSTTRAILTPFRTESWAIGVRKGREELLADVNGFLRSFREAGGFDHLGARFLAEQKQAFEGLGIEFYF